MGLVAGGGGSGGGGGDGGAGDGGCPRAGAGGACRKVNNMSSVFPGLKVSSMPKASHHDSMTSTLCCTSSSASSTLPSSSAYAREAMAAASPSASSLQGMRTCVQRAFSARRSTSKKKFQSSGESTLPCGTPFVHEKLSRTCAVPTNCEAC